MYLAQCTLEIDLAKIKANYRTLRDICQNSLVGAAVKANSYGLGANQISKALEEENCRFFFVASYIEGINLRKILSSHSNILVLNGVSQNDAAEFVEYNLIPVLNNLKQIEIWRQLAKTRNQLLDCFLHFNTGINRLGLTHTEIEHIINDRDLLEGLQVQYIMSHLAASEEANNPYNIEQLTKFKSYLPHFPNVKISLANSGAIFLGQDYHFDLVRPGMALYGLNPLGQHKPNPMKNPVTLTAPIIQLQKLTADSHIGYNTSFTTERDSIIATLPLGYADGYSRNFSNRGEVFINGHVAKIVGHVSMDLVNIDVTDLPHSQIFLGQEVEIIGNYCTPDKIATIIGTIGYEILTSLGNRYKRVYKNDT
ncbi:MULTISPECIES: alanine racemase [unclassified Rickettsia]|uniref:alanine racemase n=1 Tax=unclassified Rickettsia TaxID=114295 RepID=UPI0031332739